jgi:hypothetical protein
MKHAEASRARVYITEPKYPLGTPPPLVAEGVGAKPVTTYSDAYISVILQSKQELRATRHTLQ